MLLGTPCATALRPTCCRRIEHGHAFRLLLRCSKAQIKNQYRSLHNESTLIPFRPKVDHDRNCPAISAPPQLSGPQLYKTCPEPHQRIPRGAGNGASLRAAFAFVGCRTRRAQDAARRPAPNRPRGPCVSRTAAGRSRGRYPTSAGRPAGPAVGASGSGQ
jgi:hypothetical protein